MKSVGIATALLLAILATVEAKPGKVPTATTPATTFNDIVKEPPDAKFCYVYGQCQVVSTC